MPPVSPAPWLLYDNANPLWWVPPLIATLAAGILAYLLLRKRQQKPAVKEYPSQDLILAPSSEDPRQYARALALSRQAGHINKASALRRNGEVAKAHMEMQRALAENSVCRSPCMDGALNKEEYAALYRLHIQACEVPPNFATLLQLQEMLGLSQEEAEQIEIEVMSSPGSFSI
eukprot:CAMPEP_0202901550 /NCGR_PEP_ID=MMETSP1392-20130828/14316_1 /ASSEMBLY_ACC=CAM_ASM_000868 /TAXON_ID=225041 /ORGANISM="Chlamydomonas chlamydogama, Strain SAG 11-48b" /LENGTH=173 /DNA_ID=CAMNT_0049588129 /DNA_START=296 /DNA_END=817 /DNA_ORIENTATION=+